MRNGHKIFETGEIPVLLMVIGLKHFTQNLFLSIAVGAGIYLLASFIDRFLGEE